MVKVNESLYDKTGLTQNIKPHQWKRWAEQGELKPEMRLYLVRKGILAPEEKKRPNFDDVKGVD